MWIRTQDRKRLVDCKDIEVSGLSIMINENDGEHWHHLGQYPTESRAIEVLDEIQESINLNRYETQPVYEMPKE